MINVVDFGAVGDGVTMCTVSFEKAVAEAVKTKGAVTVPAGIYLTGTINLRGASLHLEKGAVIKASPNLEDYPVQDFVHNEMGALRALIVCLGGQDVTIDGEGTIDLNGKSFYKTDAFQVPPSRVPFTEEQIAECTYSYDDRPTQSIFFDKVQNLRVKGITVLDAPCWTFTFTECENVKVLGLTVRTDMNVPNDDGMHFCSCRGVIISDCNIESGDDCIAVTAITNWAKPCEDVVITNCVLKTCSKAIAIGYIYSHIRNVLIDNVIIKESNRGLCFMSNPECGLIENVRVKNLIIDTRVAAGNWWGNGEPIYVLGIRHDYGIPPEQKPRRDTEVNFKNIHFDSITCTGENAIAIAGTGDNIKGMTFRDIDVSLKESKNLPLKGRTMDTAPAKTVYEIPDNCGFYINGADNIVLENVDLGSHILVQE